MKKIIIALLLFSTISVFAQKTAKDEKESTIKILAENLDSLKFDVEMKLGLLNAEIEVLQNEKEMLSNEMRTINSTLTKTIMLLDSLQEQMDESSKSISKSEKELKARIINTQSENRKLRKEIDTVNSELTIAMNRLRGLEQNIRATGDEINTTKEKLVLKISDAETTTNQKFSEVDQSLNKKTLYGIIGVLIAILLSGIIYWLLMKRQQSDKSDLIEQLTKTKSTIEDSLIKEFAKQTELMDAQLEFIKQQNETAKTQTNAEPDHSLALKLASEINLIERNLNLMDSKTRGLRQLNASVGKLKDNLAANGYDMPVLIDKPFNKGIKAIVTSTIPDENLEKGIEIITKIIIPQVNYSDKMIQTAQVEVSVGY